MKKMREKIYRQKLERQLEKYGLRIQKMADNAYKIRQLLEQLDAKENGNSDQTGEKQGGVQIMVPTESEETRSIQFELQPDKNGEVATDVPERPTEGQGTGQETPVV